MNLDVAFVVALCTDTRIQAVLDAGVEVEDLMGEGKVAYIFVVEHFQAQRVVPSLSTVMSEVELDKEDVEASLEGLEPLDYYIQKVCDRRLTNVVRERNQEIQTALTSGDGAKAAELLKGGAMLVEKAESQSRKGLVTLQDSADMRRQLYEEAQRSGDGITGVRTPWVSLDEATGGLHKGELWSWVGKTGVGKSWATVNMWHAVKQQGIRSLLVSCEMGGAQILRRYDAVAARVPARGLKRGQLTTTEEQRFQDFLIDEAANNTPSYLAADGYVRSVDDLWSLVSYLKPEVLIVDGLYLLERAKPGEPAYERVSRICWVLKRIAQTNNLLVCATSQFSRKLKRGSKDADTDQIAFSDAVGQDSDGVVALYQDEDLKSARRIEVGLIKNRDGEDMLNFVSHWDHDVSNYAEIGRVGEDGGVRPQADQRSIIEV